MKCGDSIYWIKDSDWILFSIGVIIKNWNRKIKYMSKHKYKIHTYKLNQISESYRMCQWFDLNFAKLKNWACLRFWVRGCVIFWVTLKKEREGSDSFKWKRSHSICFELFVKIWKVLLQNEENICFDWN